MPPFQKSKLIIRNNTRSNGAKPIINNLNNPFKDKITQNKAILINQNSIHHFWNENHETRIQTGKEITSIIKDGNIARKSVYV